MKTKEVILHLKMYILIHVLKIFMKNGNAILTWRETYVLKVKALHLEEIDKTKGVASITLKKYEYQSFTGYFVNKISFES